MNVSAVLISKDMDLGSLAYDLQKVERLNFGHAGFNQHFIAIELWNPKGAAVVLFDDGNPVGYAAASVAAELYSSYSHYFGRDADGVAYVTNVSIHPDYQGKGYVGLLMNKLEEALREKGFTILDTDAKADNGYAAKVVKFYADRVVFAREAEPTEWGMQQYIRVRL